MKTIEEQARSFACITANGYAWAGEDVRIDIRDDLQYAFISGAKAAARWISVEDRNVRMPDLKECLLLDENGKVWTDDEFTEKRPMVIITHWLPIPPAPEK